jgi:hypothetical protein
MIHTCFKIVNNLALVLLKLGISGYEIYTKLINTNITQIDKCNNTPNEFILTAQTTYPCPTNFHQGQEEGSSHWWWGPQSPPGTSRTPCSPSRAATNTPNSAPPCAISTTCSPHQTPGTWLASLPPASPPSSWGRATNAAPRRRRWHCPGHHGGWTCTVWRGRWRRGRCIFCCPASPSWRPCPCCGAALSLCLPRVSWLRYGGKVCILYCRDNYLVIWKGMLT